MWTVILQVAAKRVNGMGQLEVLIQWAHPNVLVFMCSNFVLYSFVVCCVNTLN